MDSQLLLICTLTFIIHIVGTLAYAVRIAGVRTRRIAVSYAMFNILVLVSRTSNSFLGPFLAKRIEQNIAHKVTQGLLADFRWLIFSASIATLLGALAIPTCQRMFARAVEHFQVHRSIPKLFLHAVFKGGLGQFKDLARVPAMANITSAGATRALSTRVVLLNVFATALWTVGVLASLYAGYLSPDVRVTSSTLSSIINGVATILMFVFIDPQLSVMTDDAVEGRITDPQYRRAIVWLVGSRLLGTLIAQAFLLPAAACIAWVARSM